MFNRKKGLFIVTAMAALVIALPAAAQQQGVTARGWIRRNAAGA